MNTTVTDAFEEVIQLSRETQQVQTTNAPSKLTKGDYTMVEYSAKAIAVFGDTRIIKDELKAMGGKFNARLTFNGEKIAGWIFSKEHEQRLACYFGLD